MGDRYICIIYCIRILGSEVSYFGYKSYHGKKVAYFRPPSQYGLTVQQLGIGLIPGPLRSTPTGRTARNSLQYH